MLLLCWCFVRWCCWLLAQGATEELYLCATRGDYLSFKQWRMHQRFHQTPWVAVGSKVSCPQLLFVWVAWIQLQPPFRRSRSRSRVPSKCWTLDAASDSDRCYCTKRFAEEIFWARMLIRIGLSHLSAKLWCCHLVSTQMVEDLWGSNDRCISEC